MKIALCTTTIHIPHALKLLRKCSADVWFFVAGDIKTPVAITKGRECVVQQVLGLSDSNWQYHGPDEFYRWKCSEVIGWNTIARRNIAFLEALKWGADVIYSWDDDNIPVTTGHFGQLRMALGPPFNGIKVSGVDGWFDPGTLLVPPTRHRGFPYDKRPSLRASSVTDAKIGVAAGLVIGDPDIDATTRMEKSPDIGSVHILGSTGVVVDPGTWTVFNSQNTAVIRELMPAWFMMPGVGRHDDIYASLIVQRVARERGYYVHFGPPFTYQQRHEHNLVTDLRAEIDGMEGVSKLALFINDTELSGVSVLEDTRLIYEALSWSNLVPDDSVRAAMAWLEDCEGLGL
jgi:hypothetical protein